MGHTAVGVSSPVTGVAAEVLTAAPGSDTGQPAVAVRVISQLGAGGGGGGGGAVTVADGADVALGTTTDTAWSSGAGTVVSLLKKLAGLLAGTLTTNATLTAETTKVIGTVNQGTSPWVVNDPGLPDTLGQKTMANSTGVVLASDQASIPVAATLAASSAVVGHVIVDTAPTTPVTGTFWQTTQPVSASTLPLPSGASTAAKQPALGTAGSPSSDVISVQGESGMTPLKVDGSAATQPVSNGGTFAVQATPTIPASVFNGKTTVTTAGTRVALASSQAVRSVVVKALVANTGTIYVGSSAVTSSNGFALLAGDSVSLDIANLNTVNVDCSVNGDGVTYAATG